MPILDRLRQLCCRHEDVLRLGETSMWLECLACGRTTRGFQGLGRAMHRHDAGRAPRVERWRFGVVNRAA